MVARLTTLLVCLVFSLATLVQRGPRDQTRVIRLEGKCLYLLNHFTSLPVDFIHL
ncbi:rCG38898, isoform CRA_a [Rattus norvegicus]|uniref:RCG38898, isoform CRA_a n=1 Tax=Rattus norvegicus TaxID=10116 RepID=A6KUR4_RAT|nr:rCG38898, isoform CRA_a [Rattus norvegicus]